MKDVRFKKTIYESKTWTASWDLRRISSHIHRPQSTMCDLSLKRFFIRHNQQVLMRWPVCPVLFPVLCVIPEWLYDPSERHKVRNFFCLVLFFFCLALKCVSDDANHRWSSSFKYFRENPEELSAGSGRTESQCHRNTHTINIKICLFCSPLVADQTLFGKYHWRWLPSHSFWLWNAVRQFVEFCFFFAVSWTHNINAKMQVKILI